MPADGAVYAPHIYTRIFNGTLDGVTLGDLEPSVRGTRTEAEAWETPVVIGEYGCGPGDTNGDLWMGWQAELHDKYLAGDAFWVWKEQSQGSWGVFDFDATTRAWTERPQVVRWLSRVHAARIAGYVDANLYDHETDSLELRVTPGTTNGVPHEIYIPERAATTFTARCDDAPLSATRDAATGLISVVCDGVLRVTP
jgi:hypothetical protein